MPLDGRIQHYTTFSLRETQMIYIRISLIEVSMVTTKVIRL